jgi:uncharacterized protein
MRSSPQGALLFLESAYGQRGRAEPGVPIIAFGLYIGIYTHDEGGQNVTKTAQSEVGTIESVWRYPVKSMMGEVLASARITVHGLWGDRVYAILDRADGKVATAKHPQKWPDLFAFDATLLEPSGNSQRGHLQMSPVRITLPDRTVLTSAQRDLDLALSKALNREVSLVVTEGGQVTGIQSSLSESWRAQSEEYWPDIEGREQRDTVTDFSLPTGTFFDSAMVHLLTTATLNRLRDAYPQGRFEVQRFRPNLVVESVGEAHDFVEQAWIGHTLAIGNEVRLQVTGSCGRCVMTTLAQRDLPKDPGILRAAVQHNQGHVGVYASVASGGIIRPGDRVRLEE